MVYLSEEIATFIMLFGSVPSLLVIYFLWSHRRKPSVIWILSSACGFLLWGISFTTIFSFNSDLIVFISTNIFTVAPFLTAISWFLFCYEFTFKKQIANWIVYIFIVLVGIELLLAIFNPSEVMYTADPLTKNIFPADPKTLRFVINVVVSYILVLLGTGMIIGELFRTENSLRRKQSIIIISSTIILVLTSLCKVIKLVPVYFDPTPIAVSVGFLLLSYSIKYHQLGRQVPVARQRTVELSDDAMLVADDKNILIDANDSAKQLFGENILGMDITELIDLSNDKYTFETHPGKRIFKATHTDLEYGRGTTATLHILSEITQIKKKEEELDIVQNIMQRVFRHNIRNKLTPIMGRARLIKETATENQIKENAQSILENAQKLHSTSEKAVEIGNVLNERNTTTKEIGTETLQAIKETTDKYPDATINYTIEDTTAIAHPQLTDALEEALDNALLYNDNPEMDKHIYVKVRDTPTSAEIWIADNGTTIPQMEIEVIEQATETPTKHSNGAGLWLIKWIIQRSNGTLQFYTHDKINGTVIKLSLPK